MYANVLVYVEVCKCTSYKASPHLSCTARSLFTLHVTLRTDRGYKCLLGAAEWIDALQGQTLKYYVYLLWRWRRTPRIDQCNEDREGWEESSKSVMLEAPSSFQVCLISEDLQCHNIKLAGWETNNSVS